MSKSWKTFNFAPFALFEPKTKTGATLENFVLPIFNQKLGGAAFAFYQKCATAAGLYVVAVTLPNGQRARFATGLAYPIRAPLDAGDLENGMGIDANKYPALDAERKKIQRTVGAVLDRFAPLLTKAKAAQEALEFGDAGRATSTTTSGVSSSSSSSSSGTRTDLFKAGTASGVAGTPSGKTETSDSGSAEASTETNTNTNNSQSMGFLGQVEALREFQNGGLEAVEESAIDAIFEAIFEPMEQPEDRLYFGELNVKKWG